MSNIRPGGPNQAWGSSPISPTTVAYSGGCSSWSETRTACYVNSGAVGPCTAYGTIQPEQQLCCTSWLPWLDCAWRRSHSGMCAESSIYSSWSGTRAACSVRKHHMQHGCCSRWCMQRSPEAVRLGTACWGSWLTQHGCHTGWTAPYMARYLAAPGSMLYTACMGPKLARAATGSGMFGAMEGVHGSNLGLGLASHQLSSQLVWMSLTPLF